MSYRLSRRAEQDVIDIYVHTARTYGAVQAEAYHDKLANIFELLAGQPHIARERKEIDPPVRVHPCGAHVVIYTVSGEGEVLINRIRHSREDWRNDSAAEG